jgi:hypothetical protein
MGVPGRSSNRSTRNRCTSSTALQHCSMHKIHRSSPLLARSRSPRALHICWGHRSSKGVAAARLPFLSSPMWAAPGGTADAKVFDQIFVQRHYDIRVHPQWAQLQRKYQEIHANSRILLIVDCGANVGFFRASLSPCEARCHRVRRGEFCDAAAERGTASQRGSGPGGDRKGWATGDTRCDNKPDCDRRPRPAGPLPWSTTR